MIGISLCKAMSHVRCGYKLCFPLQNPSILSLKYASTTSNQHSFTVSYLVTTFGFSLESALSASKYVHFETPDKPDSVINFFKNHGFSKSQISLLVRRRPTLLTCNPEKIILPKIEFFYSKGMSSIDLAKSLSANPAVLHRSLKDHIIPRFDYFEGLLHSDDKVITAIKRSPNILTQDPQSYIAPNIAILQQYGVPESKIIYLFCHQPSNFITKPDEFKEVVEGVKKMGINPFRFSFVLAIHAKQSMTKSTWEKKLDVYRRWSWSEEEISLAFAKYPWCMTHSEDKIMAVMDTFVNKLGWESSIVARCPQIISLSLKKRIAPRSSVIQVLLSKGLIDRSIALRTVFGYPEKLFLQKYVTPHEEKVPHLLKLYQEQIHLSN